LSKTPLPETLEKPDTFFSAKLPLEQLSGKVVSRLSPESVIFVPTKPNPIVVLGETLFDFYFDSIKEFTPGQRHVVLHGAPGGAPANVAANLASMGKPVSLISSFSDDVLGATLKDMLRERNIDLNLSSTHPQTRTAVAMVMNSAEGERSFSLYLQGSSLERIDRGSVNLTDDVDFFHFGSVLFVFEAGVNVTRQLLEQLQDQKTVRSCDINIRPDILRGNPEANKDIMDVLTKVDVLKLSDEDLTWIRDNIDASLASPRDYFRFGVKLLVYTEGPKGASLLTPAEECFVPAPQVEVVDTTGGGDAFVAGVLASLYDAGFTNRDDLPHLDQATLLRIGQRASECSKQILSQAGAMPPVK
jgi:fructokinase